ncbi:O-antigen ligase family protein [Latilactobacillus sakei]|uniref:O-antigen ligase family protein n=1 Tax=Latilactobacillus sakei TaxID=1599 RepID=UPI003CEA7971
MIRKNKLENNWLYMWGIAIIYNCFSIFTRQVNSNSSKILLLMNLFFGGYAIIKSLIKLKRYRTNISKLIFLILSYYIYILPYVYLNFKNGYYTLYTLLVMPIFFLIYFYTEYQCGNIFNLVSAIMNIMIVLSIISLFFWVFGSIFHFVHFHNSTIIEWGGVRQIYGVKFLYYEIQHTMFFGNSIPRNSGVFVEPATFGLILNIILILKLLVQKNSNLIGSIIMILTVVSTTSTTNIIVTILVLIIAFTQSSSEKFKKIKKIINIIWIPILTIVSVYIVLLLLKTKLNGESYSLRMDDFNAGLEAFKDHPFFGNGFADTTSMLKYMNTSRMIQPGKTGFSNGLLLIFIQGGLYLGIIYILPLIKMMKSGLTSKNVVLLLAPFLFLILVFSTMAQYSELDIMFVIMCIYIPNYLNNLRGDNDV